MFVYAKPVKNLVWIILHSFTNYVKQLLWNGDSKRYSSEG